MVLEKNTDDFHFEFHSEFIDNKNLVPQVLRLRSMLVEKFKNSLKKENKKNILMEKEISKGFGAQFNDRKMTPAEKEENAKALASALAKTLNNEEHTSVDNGFIKLSEIIDNLNRFKKYKEIFCKTLLKEYNYETEIRELLKRNFEKTPYFGEHFTKPEAPTEITCLCTLLIKIIKSDADKPKKNLNDVDAQKMKSLAGHVLVYHKNENCLIFSEAFFNDKIPESYKTFKKMLMEEMEKNALNYDYLRLIKFKLKTPTFQSCFEDRNVETELPLDSDNIEEKVSKFLKHFILVISPHETELSNLIKKEVSVAPNINLLDADFATNHTLVEVLDWMKAESSILFSKDKAEIIFKSLNSKISALMLAGNNSEYCKKLREYFPISANFMVNSEINSVFQNSMKSKIKNFLNSTSYILFLTSEGPICTLAIKVEQSLREIGSELINGYSLTSKDSFVFNPLSRILRMEEDVINILNRPKQKTLLIIVCYEDSKTCDSIIDKVNEDNKIIFIGSKNSKIFQTLEVRPQNFETDNDSNNDFSSLTEKAQKYLLNKNVKFYDEIVSLEQVFDLQAAKGLVDAILFEKLVLNDEVKLIEKKENCFDRHDIDYYVSRGFYQCTEFTESVIDYIKNVPTDAIVIEQYESNDTIFKNISIVNYNEAEVKYNELCKKYNNVHWLKKEFNKFFWIKSHGSIAKLVMHQVHSESESNEHDNARIYSKNEILQFVEGNKILILSNVAGMGKSIITSKMACFFQNMNAAFIVVKISFTDHRPILQRIKFDDNEQLVLNLENMDDEILKKGKELIHLLFCLKNETLKKQGFEEKLFQYYFKNGRMIIMFDGFDEIMENMKVIVLKFISKLKSSTKHKIWITSRVAFKETLETTFDAFSFTLKPFDDKDQTKFLKKYWTSKYSKINDNKTALTAEIEEKIRIYAAKFLDLYKDSIQEKNRNFIGIPLQLEMLAEIYKRKEKKDDKWEGCFDYIENAIDDSPTLPPIINLFQLYEKFVEIKIKDKYYYGKTRTQRGDPILDPMFKSRFEDALNYHQLFALALLVSDESLKQILLHSKQDELKGWTDKMKSGEENAGIIIKIVDGKPHFIHLTFAEYFAALYLTKNCVKASEFPDFF
uniref:NACHT domain-containing protein n=1 Tax=Panagrolaimus superbus TaxID=310955 RepID=A0A914Y3W1_9BILA